MKVIIFALLFCCFFYDTHASAEIVSCEEKKANSTTKRDFSQSANNEISYILANAANNSEINITKEYEASETDRCVIYIKGKGIGTVSGLNINIKSQSRIKLSRFNLTSLFVIVAF